MRVYASNQQPEMKNHAVRTSDFNQVQSVFGFERRSIQHLQHNYGNQSVKRMLQSLPHDVKEHAPRDPVYAPVLSLSERQTRPFATNPFQSVWIPEIQNAARKVIQREADNSGPDSGIDEFEDERRRFESAQADYYREVGTTVRSHILHAAGFAPGQTLSTPEDALRVVQLWNIGIDTLTTGMPQLGASLTNQLRGRTTDQELEQRQQTLIAALTPEGQHAFQSMIQSVRSEPFWRERLDNERIHILPDITGSNRYNGYTQRGSYRTPEGLTRTAYFIHISKDRLNNGDVAGSAAILIHELSHTVQDVIVTARTLQSLTHSLSDLLADHPQIAALRQSAPDQGQARQTHIAHIRQIIFEHTGYGEAEIFVHLQQLSHQPPVTVPDGTIQAHHYILGIVEGYLNRLRRIGFPPDTLRGILDSIRRRVVILYDRRIAAAPPGSTQRRMLELTRDQAVATFNVACHP